MEQKLMTGFVTGQVRKDGRIAVGLICGHVVVIPFNKAKAAIRVDCVKCSGK